MEMEQHIGTARADHTGAQQGVAEHAGVQQVVAEHAGVLQVVEEHTGAQTCSQPYSPLSQVRFFVSGLFLTCRGDLIF